MNALPTDRVSDIDVNVPVLKEPVTAAGLVSLLRSQLGSMNLPRIRRNDHVMAIRRLEAYAAAVPHDPLIVDEALLNDFENWLVGGDESRRRYHRKPPSHIRSLVNMMPGEMRNRRLLTNRELRRLSRFDEFTPETRVLLERFLADGRNVKRKQGRLVLTPTLLSPATRENAVFAAKMIMGVAGLDQITGFGQLHVDRYFEACGEAGRGTAVHTLGNMHCLIRNLVASGKMKEDPLAAVGHPKSRVNREYVPGDQIGKLQDLKTLDMSDFESVRDRMIVFVLLYDFPLRIGEAVTPELSGVRIADFVELTFLGEKKGGSEREPVTQRSLFPESKVLMSAYLALRPKTDSGALLVGSTGKPLGVSGCRSAVKRVCGRLGIRSDKGKVPAPHRFRHSFGTLNVGELGMRLSPYFLMRRYRHRDIRTTIDVYVTHNPLLDEAPHRAVVANGNGHAADRDAKPQAMAADITVPEREAMARARSLGVNWRSLRDHATGQKAAVERNGRVFYSEAFLDRLCTEWMTRDEAMRLMGITSTTGYHNRVKNHGIETLVIGRTSLAKSADVVRSLR